MKRTVALVGLVFTLLAAAAPVASAADGTPDNCMIKRLFFALPC
jgi:hypothetical protein